MCVCVSKRMYRWFRMYGALKIHHLSQLCCVWVRKKCRACFVTPKKYYSFSFRFRGLPLYFVRFVFLGLMLQALIAAISLLCLLLQCRLSVSPRLDSYSQN